jgi:hypothetical protein
LREDRKRGDHHLTVRGRPVRLKICVDIGDDGLSNSKWNNRFDSGFFAPMLTIATAVGRDEVNSQLCDLDQGFESDMNHSLLFYQETL